MANEKMATLIKKLLARTKAGTLEWREDPFEDGFVTRVAKTNIYLKIIEGNKTLQIRNSGDTIVEEISTIDENLNYDESMKIQTLYETAKRSALGTDKIIDDIITELDDEIPF